MGLRIQLALEGSFKTVQHANTLGISFPNRLKLGSIDIPLKKCHVKVMD
jgi:hypothetical protein